MNTRIQKLLPTLASLAIGVIQVYILIVYFGVERKLIIGWGVLSTRISWMSVLERALVLFPHVAARGLVYISFRSGNPLPAVLAILTFASIDGRAYFAHLEKWPFDDIRVLGGLYRQLALIAVVQTLLFTFFYHQQM